PGDRHRLGLDARQAARQAARRRAAAGDLRSRRLGRARHDDERGRGGRDLGDARRRRSARSPGAFERPSGARPVARGARGRSGMNRFAHLLDALLFTPSRNGKLRLMKEYFTETPDPERGWALAALTGELSFNEVKPAQIRDLVLSRVDAELFAWSYDFVGDLAETASLIWPVRPGADHVPALAEIVAELDAATRASAGERLERWLDALDATGRWALLKLITGGLRVGVSARLAKTALAQETHVSLEDVEAVWHGLAPPYSELFAWLDGKAPRPEIGS